MQSMGDLHEVFPEDLKSVYDEAFIAQSSSSNSSSLQDLPPILAGRKTVLVRNLPNRTTKGILRAQVDPFGHRLSFTCTEDPSSGFVRSAEIKFTSPQQAGNFITCFNGRRWPGTHTKDPLDVQLAPVETRPDDPEKDRLYVANIPPLTTDTELKRIFSRFGTLSEITVDPATDDTTPLTASVRYGLVEHAVDALTKLHDTVLFPDRSSQRIVVKFWKSPRQRVHHEHGSAKSLSVAATAITALGPRADPCTPMPEAALVMTTNAQGIATPLKISNLHPQSGDVAIYGAPIGHNALVQLLTNQYGPVMYCLPVPQLNGGYAVRMRDVSLHQRLAVELNGASLSTGGKLCSGVIKVD